jgi:predicted nucleic acid-binding Zn finger protein
MNRKAETTVLEVIIGVVIAAVVFTITTITLLSLVKAGDAEEDSFFELVDHIKELSDSKLLGDTKVMVFAHKEESFLYPYTSNLKKHRIFDKELNQHVEINLPHTDKCKDNCFCLCQKFEGGTCAQGELICEHLPNVKLSLKTQKVVSKKEYPASAQRLRVRIIKCKSGQEYCKQSNDGDISVIFDLLDQNRLYDDIK